tara:strand:- start:756 stop:1094 length:339 start_codon:yes stop_codon:yes gene_type:complete
LVANNKNLIFAMIKAEVVNQISLNTGVERKVTQAVVENFMDIVRLALEKGENVYLREFGTFAIKKKAAKKARNIVRRDDGYITTTITIPAHVVPSFKPAKKFVNRVKNNNQI